MATRCAILDDYQNVALKVADWGKVKDRVEIKHVEKKVEELEERKAA